MNSSAALHPEVDSFFDSVTGTLTHVVHAGRGSPAAIIDSVLDYEPKSGRTSTAAADRVIAHVRDLALQVQWILETHAHADHLSAAPYLKQQLGGRIGIGGRITQVQKVFKAIFNLEPGFCLDGSQFDHLFQEGERFAIGALQFEVLYVPGHTPACAAYHVGDALFVGDTLFPPDLGSARCDFPGGDAHTLYVSMKKILAMPEDTRLFLCHDYPPNGRAVRYQTTVAEQRASNIHVHDGVSEQEFVDMRTRRDATLDMPTLILPSVQVNIRAGELPPPEANGVSYLKIPVNAL
jgi:glyoxylase-like metal-dependent hydrolase (beta-lactamase superfamily II)